MVRLGKNFKRTVGLAVLLLFSAAIPLAAPLTADVGAGAQAYDAGDIQTAIEEWQASAAEGELDALVALASLTEDGIGLRQDYGAAAALYRRAAQQGHPVAQLNLGDYYSRGQGLERDLVQAHFWLSLAVAQGRNWPAARRAAIVPLMTEAEIAQARALVENWGD